MLKEGHTRTVKFYIVVDYLSVLLVQKMKGELKNPTPKNTIGKISVLIMKNMLFNWSNS